MSNLEDHVKAERDFLHDLSNHLTIAHGMGGFVLSALEKSVGPEDKQYIRMKKSADAVQEMVNIINKRRNTIKVMTF